MNTGRGPPAVRDLYLHLLACKSQKFDLTLGGIKACFENCKNFTVRSRDKFTRNLKFLNPDVLTFEDWEIV